MDTGSESFRSQDTPNSVLSSDFENEDVLRLQNPDGVLRLSEPERIDTRVTKLKSDLNDSLISKMSTLSINSVDNRPRNLGISPPRLTSTLTLTTNHPLMGLASPDENYPDVVPKKSKVEDDKDLSLSSIEDERNVHTNGYELYSPQRNTSKNNLYFSENFVTAESQLLAESLNTYTPDVARIEQKERRKIIPRFTETKKTSTPVVQVMRPNGDDSAMVKYVEERNKKLSNQSTPKPAGFDGSGEFHCGVSAPV